MPLSSGLLEYGGEFGGIDHMSKRAARFSEDVTGVCATCVDDGPILRLFRTGLPLCLLADDLCLVGSP